MFTVALHNERKVIYSVTINPGSVVLCDIRLRCLLLLVDVLQVLVSFDFILKLCGLLTLVRYIFTSFMKPEELTSGFASVTS